MTVSHLSYLVLINTYILNYFLKNLRIKRILEKVEKKKDLENVVTTIQNVVIIRTCDDCNNRRQDFDSPHRTNEKEK